MVDIKNIVTIAAFMSLIFYSSVQAVQGVDNQNKPEVSPTGKVIQNSIKTQNQGEDQKLQIETQEQEGTQSGRGENLGARSQAAIQSMSTVSQKVQEMLELKTTGGIGYQIRQIAGDQNQAQTQIQEHLEKIESKGRVARFFFGPDYNAISDIQKLLEQNRIRIQELQQLHAKLKNTGDQTLVQATVQAMEQQNVSLQNKLNTESKTFSLFGWLFKLLSK